MALLYRLFMTVSALLVIVIGGSWFADKYDVGLNIDWWDKADWASQYRTNLEGDGVPAKETGDVSVQVGAPFGRIAWVPQGEEALILPVIYGQSRFFGFNMYSYGYNRSYKSGGACNENMVNLLVINKENPAGKPVFKSRVLLPRYFYFKIEAAQSVAALVIRKDTNNDGRLDCGDEAQFEIISLTDDDVRVSDRVFIPDNISQIRYVDQSDSFIFSEVKYTEDNVSITSIKLSRQDLTAIETHAPDLLSKAKAAFNNTKNE